MTPTRTMAAAAVIAALAVAGLGVAPAQSAPDPSCPTPYPLSQVAADQSVNGLTVTKGTTPDAFTGSVLGVLEDGIGPGIDMIMVRLTSPELERVGGIWQGMSGSPVYGDDGRLLGAVSYGLAWGPSTVAGVTPAAEMEELLENPPVTASPDKAIPLTEALTRKVAASGAATAREARQGMSQLTLPFGISGVSNQKHFDKVRKLFTTDAVQVRQAGATSAAKAATPIVAGGNLAASISYGDVTAAAVGTATIVCGDEVVGFGHPLNFSGPATLTLHGADAVYVQEDPVSAPFKVANISGPSGTIDEDRLVGIRGMVGATPTTTDITSFVEMGSKSRTGTTRISVPEAVPDIAMSHLLADEDRIFDGYGKGSATVGWTIHGTREDGSPFSLNRTDKYADQGDITYATVFDFSDALYSIAYNGVEDVRFTSLETTSKLSRSYVHYVLDSAKVRQDGKWKTLNPDKMLKVRPGKDQKFQVKLVSPDLRTKRVVLSVPVPKKAAGKYGSLQLFGGNSGGGDEEEYYFRGQDDTGTFSQALKELRNAPHNDDVVANLDFYLRNRSMERSDRAGTGQVVDGSLYVEVRGKK